MKLSDLRSDRIPVVLKAIQSGGFPEAKDIGEAIVAAIQAGEKTPAEVLLYVAGLLTGKIRRPRGRPRSAALNKANKKAQAVLQAEFENREYEKIRQQLERTNKPHTDDATVAEYKAQHGILPEALSVKRRLRAARATLRVYNKTDI